MKKKFKILIIIAALFLTVSVIPVILIYNRAPVLIVTEESFLGLYGADRIKRETIHSSIALIRMVKTVAVANDAGDDIVSLAVSDIAAQPYCVIFPLRFARAAKLYREQNPDIAVVLLEGRYPENQKPSSFAIGNNVSDYFIYKTDIETDFYRLGFAAAAIASSEWRETADVNEEQESAVSRPPEKKTIAVFWEAGITRMKTVFNEAMSDYVNGKVRAGYGQSGTGNEGSIADSKEIISDDTEDAYNGGHEAEYGEQAAGSSEKREDSMEQAADWSGQTDDEGELPAEEIHQAGRGERIAEKSEQAEGREQSAEGRGTPENSEPLTRSEGHTAEGGERTGENGELAADIEMHAAEADNAAFFSTWDFAGLGWLRAAQSEETGTGGKKEAAEELILAPESRFFSSFSQFSDDSGLSCAIFVDSGVEFFEKRQDIPVVIFSWLDLNLMPDAVVMVIDDSPWVQVVQIARMAAAGMENGLVASKFHFLDKKIFNKEIMRKIKKTWKNDKIRI